MHWFCVYKDVLSLFLSHCFLTGASVWGTQHCELRNFCITLSDADITAEAGLCVVIPCSFTTDDDYTIQHIVWYNNCDSSTKCGDYDIIFHSNKLNTKVQPDVSQGNCSIIINDLTQSDSGGYQLRVERADAKGYTFSRKTTVTVTGMKL